MKILTGALALILAAPVAAQTAPPADAHQGHAQHQNKDGEHKMDCCKDGKMPCCEKARQQGQKPDCCDKDAEHGQHKGHGASN